MDKYSVFLHYINMTYIFTTRKHIHSKKNPHFHSNGFNVLFMLLTSKGKWKMMVYKYNKKDFFIFHHILLRLMFMLLISVIIPTKMYARIKPQWMGDKGKHSHKNSYGIKILSHTVIINTLKEIVKSIFCHSCHSSFFPKCVGGNTLWK